jgi:ABC-type transport system involved in multi-copper enzyme maturation permease subunit
MKFLAIIGGTVREGIARKTILGMFIVSTVSIIVAVLLFQMNAVQSGLLSPQSAHIHHGQAQFTAPAPQQQPQLGGLTVLDGVWTGVAMSLLGICIFVGTFVTASFVTSIMEKGSIDLLLSKPVPRWHYIAGRYTGALLIIFSEVAYLIFGLWLVAGFSLGSWNPNFLLSAIYITIAFAGIYSLITLFGVLTKSSWFATIIGLALYILAGVIIPIGLWVDKLLNGEPSGSVLTTVAQVIKYLIPSNAIGKSLASILLNQPSDISPLFITIGLSVAYVALSCFAFSKKEF